MTEPLIPTTAEADDALAAGVYVGPYIVEELLGAGMFGTVYAARHPVIGNTVAIKVLQRRYSSDPDMVARFVDEARAASHIDHSGIVKVFDFGRLEDGRRYTVMERLVGEGLDAVLDARGALPADEALAILEPLARALEAAHAAGVAHRDVKPGNIFVCAQGGPKLLDFGVAKLLGMPSDAERTATGVAVGTPAYMAPEQCLGVGVGPAVDVYALGVLAFRLLGGRLPFEVDGSVLMMAAHLNDPPPWLHSVAPGFGRAPGAVLRRMMAKPPDGRPDPVQGIAELRAALQQKGPSPMRGLAFVGLAVALAGAAFALWPTTPPEAQRGAMIGGADSAPLAPAPVADAAADAAPDMATDASPESGPTAVRITLDGLPEGGTVTHDGQVLPVADGAVALPAGADPLALRITAPGFRDRTVQVVPDLDRTVDARLPRIPRPKTPQRPSEHSVDDW